MADFWARTLGGGLWRQTVGGEIGGGDSGWQTVGAVDPPMTFMATTSPARASLNKSLGDEGELRTGEAQAIAAQKDGAAALLLAIGSRPAC
eukprot:365893-Chlamydomonas_euryale.AAC.4